MTVILCFSVVTPSIFLVLSLIFTCHGIYSITVHWDLYKNQKTITGLTIISMILFSFCMIWCVSHSFHPFTSDPEYHSSMSNYGGYLTFNLGKITMYLLFLSILHFSFKNTKPDHNKLIKIIYILFATIIPISSIILDTIKTWDHENISKYNDDTWDQIKRYTEHGNSIILSLFATFSFIRSLYRLAWKLLKHSDNNDKIAFETTSIFMDEFIKYTILVIIIVLFGLVVLILVILTHNNITFGMKAQTWFLFVWIVYYIDCFVNILCIYLRFQFSSKIYYKLCGYCCHECCKQIIIKKIKSKKLKCQLSTLSSFSVNDSAVNDDNKNNNKKSDLSSTVIDMNTDINTESLQSTKPTFTALNYSNNHLSSRQQMYISDI